MKDFQAREDVVTYYHSEADNGPQFYVTGSVVFRERTGEYEVFVAQGEIPEEKQTSEFWMYEGAYLPRYSSWMLTSSASDSNINYAILKAISEFARKHGGDSRYDAEGIDLLRCRLTP
jgi:hypothetical protein